MCCTGAALETVAWSAISATAVDEAAAVAVAAVGPRCPHPGSTACHVPQQTVGALPTLGDWHRLQGLTATMGRTTVQRRRAPSPGRAPAGSW